MDIANDADRLQVLLYSAYDSDTVRGMERPLLDDGVPLMRMAASAVADTTMRLLDDEDLAVEDSRIVVLAGAGDNGGRLVCGCIARAGGCSGHRRRGRPFPA